MRRVAVIGGAVLAAVVQATGATVCAGCHPAETSRFLASPMGRSLVPPEPVAGGRVVHPRSGSEIAIEQRAGRMVHRLAERGLSAEYEIAYQIGAGQFAHSYIVRVNGRLFQSPATWFRSFGWDVSPGYGRAPVVDFDRPITETCLFCHAGPALEAIACERCHGDARDHVRAPTRANIVNPRRLPHRARDSVCEQCHLEGAARVLNPGKNWRDFRPGEDLERTLSVYVLNQNGHEINPVSQVEQLASSRCAAGSRGGLWCGSCHNPHGPRDVKAVCTSCHHALSKAGHAQPPSECVSCHMPRLPTGYTHVAVTDHRIVRRPGLPVEHAGSGPKTLAAWADPPDPYRRRNLALAYLTAGATQSMPELRRQGRALWSTLVPDPATLAAACEAMLLDGAPGDAVAVCRRASEEQPGSADRAMSFGIALARSGDLAAAEQQLRRAIDLDPSLKHAYAELWTLYDRQGRLPEMAETAERYLRWNPRSVMFQGLRAAVALEPFIPVLLASH